MLFVVSNPDVYKSPTSDVHIVFGEAKVRLAARDFSSRSSLEVLPASADFFSLSLARYRSRTSPSRLRWPPLSSSLPPAASARRRRATSAFSF
jgi:hypothetical protein